MKKKSRSKSKKSVSKGIGGSKQVSFIDPITSILVNSDQVYTGDSEVIRRWDAQTPSDFVPLSAEYEYSDSAIVATITSATASRPQSPFVATTRYVLQGDFQKDSSGDVTGRFAYYTHGTKVAPDFYSLPGPEDPYESIYTVLLDTQGKFSDFGESISDPSQIKYVFDYRDRVSPGDIGIESTKDRLPALGLDKFFAGDWWSDPFAPNLV